MNFKRIKSNQWSCFEGIWKCKYILEWAVVIYFDLRKIRHCIPSKQVCSCNHRSFNTGNECAYN